MCDRPTEGSGPSPADVQGTRSLPPFAGPGKLLMIGVRNFADLRPKNRQIFVRFLRI